MTTGTVMPLPFWSLVRSLNWETNCPMFTPCWPSAGPTGGAGVAAPPGTWSLIWAVTCFAIVLLRIADWRLQIGDCRMVFQSAISNLQSAILLCGFHLPVLELDRHGPAEDGQLDAHLPLGLEQLLDLALHAGEGAVADAHPVAAVEPRLLRDRRLARRDGAEHPIDFLLLHRLRRDVHSAAHEVAHARGLAEEIQNAIVVLHLAHQ